MSKKVFLSLFVALISIVLISIPAYAGYGSTEMSGGGEAFILGNANISLVSSINPSESGQSVTFTATITADSSEYPIPTGTVTFKDGVTTIDSKTLPELAGNDNKVSVSSSALSVGTHSITAEYSGDSNYPDDVSDVLSQEVGGIYKYTISPTVLTFQNVTVASGGEFSTTATTTVTNDATSTQSITGFTLSAITYPATLTDTNLTVAFVDNVDSDSDDIEAGHSANLTFTLSGTVPTVTEVTTVNLSQLVFTLTPTG